MRDDPPIFQPSLAYKTDDCPVLMKHMRHGPLNSSRCIDLIGGCRLGGVGLCTMQPIAADLYSNHGIIIIIMHARAASPVVAGGVFTLS